MISVSNKTVRDLSVFKQGLHARPDIADKSTLRQTIRNMGLLQLDSISVVERSHYLVMLSRVGLYDVAELDSLLDEGDLFEQWAHVACLIPMEHYSYLRPTIVERAVRQDHWVENNKDRFGGNPQEVIDHVMESIRENGPMSSKEFESPRDHQGSWWNWKPAKMALEILFARGDLMVSHRTNFHRYYDLTDRVLEGRVVEPDKTMEEYLRWATIAGLRHWGIASVPHIADYYREKNRDVQTNLRDLMDAGDVLPVDVEGWKDPAYIHKDDLPLLETLPEPEVTTFLTPFDNLIWYRDRVEDLFGFYYRVEMYTPKAKRQYGYYVLPILHRGELVGRLDPKVDRKTKTFIINAIYLEPDTVITDQLIEDLASTIREFMQFHNCENLEIGKSDPTKLKKEILRAFKQKR